ncbi:KRF4 protein, partial [Crypturellus undulatus]|nr:KRF4 protein [Crypturellus undulatus]
MFCYELCMPCRPCANEPCVRQCQSSTAVIDPPPVLVALPEPIFNSFPQNTVMGSSTSAAIGRILSYEGVPINSDCCDLSRFSRRYCGRSCPPA